MLIWVPIEFNIDAWKSQHAKKCILTRRGYKKEAADAALALARIQSPPSPLRPRVRSVRLDGIATVQEQDPKTGEWIEDIAIYDVGIEYEL